MEYTVEMENIGGIYRGEAALSPGLNAVRASNWQGKSSLIAAIKAAMGSGKPLTEGEDRGYVELQAGEETYRVELRREEDAVVRTGNPYLGDELSLVSAELFAFFDEDNAVRRAVRQGENLKEVLTEPLDIEDIENQIARLKREREQVERELSRAEDAVDRLPTVQERVTQLETQLDNLRAQQANIQTGKPESTELSRKRDELADLRAKRTSVETEIERLTSSIERIEDELADKRARFEEHEIPDTEDLTDDLEGHRSELERLERDAELLQSVYAANRRVLEEDRLDLLTDVDRSLAGDELECWLCGTAADREHVADHLERLSERITEVRSEAEDRRERVQTLQSKLEARTEAERTAERLERDIADLEEQLVNRRGSLESARERLTALETDIDELTTAVDDLDEKVTDLEGEIKVAEHELAEAREELDDLQTHANQRDLLADERESLTEEIARLRTRRNEIEQEVRDTFDESIQEIVELFGTGFDGAHLTGDFELVVARNGYEATLDTLSEGERELLGIIAGLAGHEVFDVGEDVPFMLLDEFGGFDEENLGILIDYLQERAECLVFTAYPEHESLDATIELGEWDLVAANTARTGS